MVLNIIPLFCSWNKFAKIAPYCSTEKLSQVGTSLELSFLLLTLIAKSSSDSVSIKGLYGEQQGTPLINWVSELRREKFECVNFCVEWRGHKELHVVFDKSGDDIWAKKCTHFQYIRVTFNRLIQRNESTFTEKVQRKSWNKPFWNCKSNFNSLGIWKDNRI